MTQTSCLLWGHLGSAVERVGPEGGRIGGERLVHELGMGSTRVGEAWRDDDAVDGFEGVRGNSCRCDDLDVVMDWERVSLAWLGPASLAPCRPATRPPFLV